MMIKVMSAPAGNDLYRDPLSGPEKKCRIDRIRRRPGLSDQ